ncbi:unnamed protein product, partial [marine sediment metagenome]
MTEEEREEALAEWKEKHPEASFAEELAYMSSLATEPAVIKTADWKERLQAKINTTIYRVTHPQDYSTQPPEMQNKMLLLYKEIMTDIEASDAPENIKQGLDFLPAIIAPLL